MPPSASRTSSEISIHALREEGDWSLRRCRRMTENFYPRPPRGGRPEASITPVASSKISIHALREEGDHGLRLPRRT